MPRFFFDSTGDTCDEYIKVGKRTISNHLAVSWLDLFELPLELRSEQLFDNLMDIRPVERGQVVTPQGYVTVPRWQASYGDDYHFSGLTHKSYGPIPTEVDDMLTYFNFKYIPEIDEKYDPEIDSFNQCLLNWYMAFTNDNGIEKTNGESYIGAHSDDEKQLNDKYPIVSISLGGTRKFRIRKKDNDVFDDILIHPKITFPKSRKFFDIELDNWDVVVMGTNFQKLFTHEIVKTTKKTDPRINITFRKFK